MDIQKNAISYYKAFLTEGLQLQGFTVYLIGGFSLMPGALLPGLLPFFFPLLFSTFISFFFSLHLASNTSRFPENESEHNASGHPGISL